MGASCLQMYVVVFALASSDETFVFRRYINWVVLGGLY